MRVLLDTNVLLAAVLTRSSCFELLEDCLREHRVFSSLPLFDEFTGKLTSKFAFSGSETENAAKTVFERIKLVVPRHVSLPALKDKDDLVVIGSALAAECEALVTGDKELLGLKKVMGLSILSPSQFWLFEVKKDAP